MGTARSHSFVEKNMTLTKYGHWKSAPEILIFVFFPRNDPIHEYPNFTD